jgi:hypothetical protein
MGKKDKKGKKLDPAKEAAKEARKALKAAKQLAKGERKALKEEGGDGDAALPSTQGDDIDTLLQQFAAMDEESDSVSLTTLLAPPSPRANCTMTYVGGGGGGEECFVYFGGEVFDGAETTCNNDVYIYYPATGVWKQGEREGRGGVVLAPRYFSTPTNFLRSSRTAPPPPLQPCTLVGSPFPGAATSRWSSAVAFTCLVGSCLPVRATTTTTISGGLI